jgi:hypothetical protein
VVDEVTIIRDGKWVFDPSDPTRWYRTANREGFLAGTFWWWDGVAGWYTDGADHGWKLHEAEFTPESMSSSFYERIPNPMPGVKSIPDWAAEIRTQRASEKVDEFGVFADDTVSGVDARRVLKERDEARQQLAIEKDRIAGLNSTLDSAHSEIIALRAIYKDACAERDAAKKDLEFKSQLVAAQEKTIDKLTGRAPREPGETQTRPKNERFKIIAV